MTPFSSINTMIRSSPAYSRKKIKTQTRLQGPLFLAYTCAPHYKLHPKNPMGKRGIEKRACTRLASIQRLTSGVFVIVLAFNIGTFVGAFVILFLAA
jgi:hypothetical protein